MGLNARFAIDRSILDLDVRSRGDGHERAQLVCIVDLEAGVIGRHVLVAGAPGAADIASLVDHHDIENSRIALSQSDQSIYIPEVRAAVRDRGGILVPGRWRAGTAIRASVGLRIGRVAVLERLPASGHASAAVSLDTARQVIETLIARQSAGDHPLRG
jgi:hypothetical protein